MAGWVSVVLTDPSLSHIDRAFSYAVPDGITCARGSIVRVPFRAKRRTAVVVALLDSPDVERTLPVHSLLGPGLPEDVVDLALWTAQRYLATEGEALAAVVPQRVKAEELTAASTSMPSRDALPPGERPRSAEAVLSALNTDAVAGVVWRPRANEDRGATICALTADVARSGRGVLILVPETRIASETVDALRARFGDALAWLGSDVSARARYRDWLALRRGDKRIAVGGRGSVFAPVRDLGLVIVDDEGHASYKEGRAPRFHARTVAAERARRGGARCLLVGVPPSIDARAAIGSRTFTLISSSRADERATRPPVTIVDLRKEQTTLVPSGRTLGLARRALDAGQRVMILAHRGGEHLDRTAARAERILKARRPVRLDAGAERGELIAARRTADLIVATPYAAKDLAVEPVGLLAFVETDAALSQPEFRAAEEAFATWWRAARWAPGGQIVVETRDASQAAIVALTRWDPDVLYRAEAARRRELGYPPFASLARIDVPIDRADEVATCVAADPRVEALGPVEREGRAVIVARARRRDDLLGALRPLVERWRHDEEPMRVDVDPWEVFEPKWRS